MIKKGTGSLKHFPSLLLVRGKHAVSDIDECATNANECQQGCDNLVGSFQCTCNDGYALNTDGKTCTGTSLKYFLIFQ